MKLFIYSFVPHCCNIYLFYNEISFMVHHTEILEIDYYMQVDNYCLEALIVSENICDFPLYLPWYLVCTILILTEAGCFIE